MHRFAHISDTHIGAWRDLRLRELNIRSFEDAYDKIIEKGVDFVIISGDLFHTNLPELESARRVVAKLRAAKERGITNYAVYGSHDYSPSATAMIDILTTAGLLTKVVSAETDEDTIKLNYCLDDKTGAKICGLSGRSYALERAYYEALDRESLEKEEGFRIFVLHSAVEEVKPLTAAYEQGVPASFLPRDLDYYAGGHIHQRVIEKIPTLGHIGYPGPLFGSNFTDLEFTAKGEKRGFIIVEFKEKVEKIKFVENQVASVEFTEINGENRTYREVESQLFEAIQSLEPRDKIILIRLHGTLSAGKPTDIDFNRARNQLYENGAEYVFLNRRGLTTREAPEIKAVGETPFEIEGKILDEALKDFRIPKTLPEKTVKRVHKHLKGERGLTLASKLLQLLKAEKPEGETRQDFETRLRQEAQSLLNEMIKQ
jgi:DNA repair exonuclease SbcCD nuclease subunit